MGVFWGSLEVKKMQIKPSTRVSLIIGAVVFLMDCQTKEDDALTGGAPMPGDGGTPMPGDGGTPMPGNGRTAMPGDDRRVVEGGGTGDTCLISETRRNIDVSRLNKIDMLFVVDNSDSMKEEQEKLRAEIPRFIRILTSGDQNSDGVTDFTPARDLHLAVVSSDMGLPTVSEDESLDPIRCLDSGDDGLFLHSNHTGDSSCSDTYPTFLSYSDGDSQIEPLVDDLECLVSLGTEGCGIEMPLEAALKALWPTTPTGEPQNALGIGFLGSSQGHGDGPHKEFLRGTPYHPSDPDALSLLVIIVVTDGSDCSAGAMGNLDFLALGFPGGDEEDLNLRCYGDGVNNWGNRYPVERYIEGFKALHPAFPSLVIFAAIAGIPSDIAAEDFDQDGEPGLSEEERHAYYSEIMSHRQMAETVGYDSQNLMPSCTVANPEFDPEIHSSDNPTDPPEYLTQAYPPRRLVEVAHAFEGNGVVGSICQDTFTSVFDEIVASISNQLGAICFPRTLTRKDDGLVECKVIWEMPEGESCESHEYLSTFTTAESRTRDRDRTRCEVNQIPVINPTADNFLDALGQDHEQGWFYDDFSSTIETDCRYDRQRIVFSLSADRPDDIDSPPSGVRAMLICIDQMDAQASSVCDTEEAEAVNRGNSDVGQRCQTKLVPEYESGDGEVTRGFDDAHIYIETNSAECGTGICGVFGHYGNPSEVSENVYCTCRCDASDDSVSVCSCPEGFKCIELVSLDVPAFEGSYCAKEDPNAEPDAPVENGVHWGCNCRGRCSDNTSVTQIQQNNQVCAADLSSAEAASNAVCEASNSHFGTCTCNCDCYGGDESCEGS